MDGFSLVIHLKNIKTILKTNDYHHHNLYGKWVLWDTIKLGELNFEGLEFRFW